MRLEYLIIALRVGLFKPAAFQYTAYKPIVPGIESIPRYPLSCMLRLPSAKATASRAPATAAAVVAPAEPRELNYGCSANIDRVHLDEDA